MSEKIVQVNEEVIKEQLKEMVQGSIEETLNELLEQKVEKLIQTARYERNETRQGYRSGRYDQNLTTTSGDITLHIPISKGSPLRWGYGAVSPPGEQRRGSTHRDVLGRRIAPLCRRHNRGTVGQQSITSDDQ